MPRSGGNAYARSGDSFADFTGSIGGRDIDKTRPERCSGNATVCKTRNPHYNGSRLVAGVFIFNCIDAHAGRVLQKKLCKYNNLL